MPNKKGFTLIELIIVLSIVSILIVISFKEYSKYMRVQASYNCVTLMLNDLKFLQEMAKTRENACGIIINPNKHSYTLFKDNNTADIIKKVDFFSIFGYNVIITQPNPNTIIKFDPKTQTAQWSYVTTLVNDSIWNGGEIIVIQGEMRSYAINISKEGKISINE